MSDIEIDPSSTRYVYCDYELETRRSDGYTFGELSWPRGCGNVGSPDRLHRAVFAAVRADFLLRLLWFRSEEKKTTASAISSRAFVDDL